MKSQFFSVVIALAALAVLFLMPLIVKHVVAFCSDVKQFFSAPFTDKGVRGHYLRQGGFVQLLNGYMGYSSGQTVELPKSTEDSLIASGQAVTSNGPATSGALTTIAMSGAATIPAGSSSVVITNAKVNKQMKVWAVVAQAAADGTLLRVERVVVADGSFTIYGTANATAATQIDWAVLNTDGVPSFPT